MTDLLLQVILFYKEQFFFEEKEKHSGFEEHKTSSSVDAM